jgi:putative addiction module component (TIGR02574 family)
MATIDDAFLIGQSLNPADRLQLISRLWETIPPTDWKPSESDLVEVKRRWAEFEAGKIKAIPWEDVWADIERQLDGDDQS